MEHITTERIRAIIALNKSERELSQSAILEVKAWLYEPRFIGEQHIEGEIQILFPRLYEEYLQWLERRDGEQLYMIGTQVICNGMIDEVIDYVPEGTEEYEYGYRYVLREEGTQTPESVSML